MAFTCFRKFSNKHSVEARVTASELVTGFPKVQKIQKKFKNAHK